MKLDRKQFREMNGYREGTALAVDPETLAKAFAYKKDFLKRFIAIGPSQIEERLGDTLYEVTRKYDGEFAMLVFQEGEAVTINRSGRTRLGLPCVDEAARLLHEAGVAQAILPAEIYVDDSDKRTRVHDLIHALSKKGDVRTLRLAFFDILELNEEPFRPESYADTWQQLSRWFEGGENVKAVEMEEAHSPADVRDLYRRWVEEGTAEGLIVRSRLPFVFKIKPRHSLEGVVIGFTEGTGDQKNQVRSFLLALMPAEGEYQVVVHVGGGMEESLRRDMFERLKKGVIPTDYIETDSNHVAFQMVEPELVMEFSVRDVIYETPNGPVMNPVLKVEHGHYVVDRMVSGLSLIAPVFEQFREDKRADHADVRLTQIQDFASFEPEEIVEKPQAALKASRLLLRDIYTKTLGGKFMLQKYLIWKTNKEQTGLYPAYILYYVNYSSGRQEPLQREIRASASKRQMMELYQHFLDENIKQGWAKYESDSGSAPASSEAAPCAAHSSDAGETKRKERTAGRKNGTTAPPAMAAAAKAPMKDAPARHSREPQVAPGKEEAGKGPARKSSRKMTSPTSSSDQTSGRTRRNAASARP